MLGEMSISICVKSTITSESHLVLIVSLIALSSSQALGSGGKATKITFSVKFSVVIGLSPE
jgi:hypothetical protein